MSERPSDLSYEMGERVRIDIPDENDPDFRHHGKNEEIISIIQDHASDITGDPQDDGIYRVELDAGDVVDVRGLDMRPPI